MGCGYIHSSEYEAWMKINHIRIGVTELRALKAIDRAFVHFQNTKDDPPKQESGGFFKQLMALSDATERNP